MAKDHLISRFYLKGFANSDNKVFLKDVDKSRQASIKSASVIDSYFSDIAGNDEFENFIAKYESKAAPAFAKIINGSKTAITEAELQSLFEFVCLTFLKSPRARRLAQDVGKIFQITNFVEVRNLINNQNALISRSSLSNDYEILLDLKSSNLDDDRDFLLKDMHMNTVKRIISQAAKLRYDFKLEIVEFRNKKLLTCDSPVVLFSKSRLSTGLAECDQIYFPLARNIGLIYSRIADGILNDKYIPSVILQETLNSAISASARKYLVSHPDDSLLLENLRIDAEATEVDIDQIVSQMSNVILKPSPPT